MRVLVIAWAPGGNLPPMLAAASLLARRGHDVRFVASGATRAAVEQLGFEAVAFKRTPDPDTTVAFETHAEATMAMLAGGALALDARDAVNEARPHLAVVDCMLPAAIVGARAAGVRTVALVHFLHAIARRAVSDSLDVADLALVTAPRWFDLDAGAPDRVVHAGPLGVDRSAPAIRSDRPRVLLTFSSTVMLGQPELIERACVTVAGFDVDAVLTLGPAVQRGAVRVPGALEVIDVADHDRLMPGCAAVISHGGLGTVLRALAHGVPLLLLPLGRDQAFNARRVEALGAGLQLRSDAPPERIASALHALISQPRFADAAGQLRDRIAAEDPDRAAVAVLEGQSGAAWSPSTRSDRLP